VKQDTGSRAQNHGIRCGERISPYTGSMLGLA
jgi:hypothetical protein